MIQNQIREMARKAAFRGLEYDLRKQNLQIESGDYGRFPFIVNCRTAEMESLTTNWITGIQTSVMLDAFRITGEQRFLDSARAAVVYLKSLQEFRPWMPRCFGAMHEVTPGDVQAHPRDGVSAAMGLLDFAECTGDKEALQRADLFGQWFVKYGMEPGYPFWTLRFDGQDWQPAWHGSFHSGSAYFLTRLGEATGNQAYLDGAGKILDFYNEKMLSPEGRITVVREHGSGRALDDCADPAWAPEGWIRMHQYNDDFGALANMHFARVTGRDCYAVRAADFLKEAVRRQRPDGGFGPGDWQESIPNAGGMILLELMNARRMNLLDESYDSAVEKCVEYLVSQQFLEEGHPFHGAFHGMTGEYTVDRNYCNARATTYAVMALMKAAGLESSVYCA